MALIYKLGVASDSSHSGATHTTYDIFAKYAVFDASGNQIRVNDYLGDNFANFDEIVAPGQYSGTASPSYEADESNDIGSFALLTTPYSQWIDGDKNIYHRRKNGDKISYWEKIPLMACGDMTWPENNEANYNSSRSGQLEFFENAIGYFLNSDSSWIRFIPSVPDSSGDHDIELGLADDGQGRAVVRRNKFSGYDTPPVTDKEVFLLDKNGNTAVENLLISSGHNYEDALAISYNATDETKAPKFSFNTLNFLLPASYTASNPPNETLATREYIQNAALQFDNYTHGAQFRVGSLNEQTAGSVDNWTKNNDSLIPGYYIFNANDDFVFLVGGGESDQGYGILGTGDNGNEPIYVAQFNTTGDWGNKSVNEIGNANRYITLLDKNGYTVLNHLISPQFALGSEGSDLFYYKNDNPSVYGLGFNINGAAVNDRGVLIDQSKALLRFNSPDFSFILGDAGKSENNRGYRYISFADSSFGSMSNDQAINVASENYVQNYSQKKQTYTWTAGNVSSGKRVVLGQFIKGPTATDNYSALHITGACGTWQAADRRCVFDFVIGNRLDSSNLDLRTGIKGYIKGTSGNNIDFYITKSDPNNPDSTDILYLEYGSYPFISFTVECSAQFNLDSHLLNEADLSANTGMSQIITDFDLSEQNSENTTTAVRIFKELQVIDAVATPTTSGLMTAGDKIKLDNIDVKSVSFSEKEVSTAIPTAHQVTVTKSDGTEENFQFASSESPIVEYLTATIEGDELVLTTTTGHVSNTRYLTAKVQDNILYFKEGD